jgi:zinc D-Ala-D-Ala dipeptidase
MVFLFHCQNQSISTKANPGMLEQKLQKAGLVDVQTLDPAIQVDLVIYKQNNLKETDVNGDLDKCYLQKEVAQKLVKAQKKLKTTKPEYCLLVYGCARPRSVQYQMWEMLKGTPQQRFIANPKTGSVHNFGAAVDLTVADQNGKGLDMGAPFLFLGDLSKPALEKKFLANGTLKKFQFDNRQLLRKVMLGSGFSMIANEWWHFNGFPVKIARKKYQIIE